MKYSSFSEWARYFVWNFKGYLWNSTQNILPIHWKIRFWYNAQEHVHIFEMPPQLQWVYTRMSNYSHCTVHWRTSEMCGCSLGDTFEFHMIIIMMCLNLSDDFWSCIISPNWPEFSQWDHMITNCCDTINLLIITTYEWLMIYTIISLII